MLGQGYRPTLFALPQYAGWCMSENVKSLIEITRDLAQNGYPFDMVFGHDSAVHRNRYRLTELFYSHPMYQEYERMMFIDADMSFTTTDVMRLQDTMTDTQSDVTVGVYRLKREGSELAAHHDGELLNMADLPKEPFPVDYAGTGFMLIDRQALHRIEQALPDIAVEDTTDGTKGTKVQKLWFSFGLTSHGDTNVELPEDYNFCKSVRDAGGKIIMCPDVVLPHWGLKGY